jgi:RNA polymerase sigma-70 factor (ECF subfamily)
MNGSPSQSAAFCGLFTTHRESIWAYCHRRLRHDDVQDAVLDVFLQAWRMDQAPEGDESLLWLYGIARNVVRNTRRSETRRNRLHARANALGGSSGPDPEMQVIRRAEERELLEAVDRLKPLDRELLRLRTWEELSLAEIAAVTGMSIRAALLGKAAASAPRGPSIGAPRVDC